MTLNVHIYIFLILLSLYHSLSFLPPLSPSLSLSLLLFSSLLYFPSPSLSLPYLSSLPLPPFLYQHNLSVKRQQEKALRLAVHTQRSVAARSQRYYSEYEVSVRKKLQRERTKEEQVVTRHTHPVNTPSSSSLLLLLALSHYSDIQAGF